MTNDRIKALEDALLPFSRMAEAMFARNWNRDGVAVSFVEKDGPVRLTFADFLAAHDALAEIQKTGAGHQRALRITGPNGDGEYWLHIEADGRSGGINLGSDHGPICKRLLDAASQPAQHVQPGAPVTLTYTNWKGETAERTIIPRRIWWGSTEWHPEPQWLLTAFDVDKGSERDFSLKDFGQPITVQDAARVVADGLADGEVWRVAVNGAAAILNSGMPGSYWPRVKQIREALDAILRAIAEGRA